MIKAKTLGNIGEATAESYLRNNEYKILERNYKNKFGEIDLIAEKDGEIVFIEVKARTSAKFGLPREAVNYHKQLKIRKVAEFYLMVNKKNNNKVRFDVIEFIPQNEIIHIKNCF